ncbi:cytochrome P450 [Mycena galericulata]|nr:cytochrome P450 [Mycena galericulata]
MKKKRFALQFMRWSCLMGRKESVLESNARVHIERNMCAKKIRARVRMRRVRGAGNKVHTPERNERGRRNRGWGPEGACAQQTRKYEITGVRAKEGRAHTLVHKNSAFDSARAIFVNGFLSTPPIGCPTPVAVDKCYIKWDMGHIKLATMNTIFMTIGAGLFAINLHRLFLRFWGPSLLDNIPGPSRTSLISGNLGQLLDPDGWDFQESLETNYGHVVKIWGPLGSRGIYVFDPLALNEVLTKDTYEATPMLRSMMFSLFGPGIFSATEEDHRRHRKMLLPAFALPNLRNMFPAFLDVAEKVRDSSLSSTAVSDGAATVVDMNSIFGRASLEIIGRSGIGYPFNQINTAPEQKNTYAETLKSILDMSRFIHATAQTLVESKKAHLEAGTGDKDIMSLLLNRAGETYLTDDELVAQTSTIILAGTDTTSSALSRLFHILSQNPEVQNTLRSEILSGKLDYESVSALPYLDSVIRETLRLTTEDVQLPLAIPLTGLDGGKIVSISVPKGTTVYVAVNAANHSQRLWGWDSLKFKPERWINSPAGGFRGARMGVYGNTMTFTGGRRSCIGYKFAEMEIRNKVENGRPRNSTKCGKRGTNAVIGVIEDAAHDWVETQLISVLVGDNIIPHTPLDEAA